MLTAHCKQGWERFFRPLANILVRLGVSPTVVTLACPLLTALVCAWLIRTRAVLPFSLIMVLVSALDMLDGAVARASGRVTRFGAYLDAVADRYVDAIVAFSVAWVTGYWLLTMLVLVGSLFVSYTKARAAMEVPITNLEWPDLMERTERILLFLAGLAASRLVPWRPLGHDLFWWTLIVLIVLIHSTVIQRILRARRFILQRSSS